MAAFQRVTSILSHLCTRTGMAAAVTLMLCTVPGSAAAGQVFVGHLRLDSELSLERAGLQLPPQYSFLDRLAATLESDGGVPVPLLTAAVNSATIGLSALSLGVENIAAGERFASTTTVMLDFGVGRGGSQSQAAGGSAALVALTIHHRFR